MDIATSILYAVVVNHNKTRVIKDHDCAFVNSHICLLRLEYIERLALRYGFIPGGSLDPFSRVLLTFFLQ